MFGRSREIGICKLNYEQLETKERKKEAILLASAAPCSRNPRRENAGDV